MSDKGNKTTVTSHIREIRTRLIRSVIIVLVLTIVAFVFWEQILELLKYPVKDIPLITTELTESIGTAMKISITAGIIASMPWLIYEVIMFVSPALTRREKKYVYLIIPWIALMFIAGVAFAYFIVMPSMLGFLYTFGQGVISPMPRLKDFISLSTRLLVIIGIIFELPVLTTFLARIGILKPEWLTGKWKIAIVASFIIAAIVTPTPDPINCSIVATPMIVLYFMCIGLAKLVYKKKKDTEEQQPSLD